MTCSVITTAFYKKMRTSDGVTIDGILIKLSGEDLRNLEGGRLFTGGSVRSVLEDALQRGLRELGAMERYDREEAPQQPQADCWKCRHAHRETFLQTLHCEWNGKDCDMGCNFQCAGFEVKE